MLRMASGLPTTSGEAEILIVEDDPAVAEITSKMLAREGFPRIHKAGTGKEALQRAGTGSVSAVLLDLGLPDIPGETVLEKLKEEHPEVPVIVVTALGDVDTAVRCMSNGAFDYVVKGSDPARIVTGLRRALLLRRKEREFDLLRERMQAGALRNPNAFGSIITRSERMKSLFLFIEAVAPTEEPVLITGETGTGKELFARAVHDASDRKGSFIAVNLGGVDETLLSDTLFGHRGGAFTGAGDNRTGLIASAVGGTLFLDEIGDLPPASQVKLLRLLENREYFPLGADAPRKSEARIVAATNHDLNALAAAGKFRKDLLYRLSVFHVAVPPLRERPEDIPLLAAHWLSDGGSDPATASVLSSEALAFLSRHSFPGNLRELRGVLLRARVAKPRGVIEPDIFSGLIGDRPPTAAASPNGRLPVLYPEKLPSIRQIIDDLIDEAMARAGGKQHIAAGLLGITPQALSKRLKNKKFNAPEE